MKTRKLGRRILALMTACIVTALSAVSALAIPGTFAYQYAPKVTIHYVNPTEKTQYLNNDTKVVLNKGSDGVNSFLKSGGASSITDTLLYLGKNIAGFHYSAPSPKTYDACTAFQVKNKDGGYYFGRNFDYTPCDALIILNEPKEGYKSISTADTNFITDALKGYGHYIPDDLMKKIGLYMPLDGLNEKGVGVSINMIDSPEIIDQDTGKTDQICVTAARTILDKAANVDQAIQILKDSDFHTWKGFMVHLFISDAQGHHVTAEWYDNQLHITETDVITNFYVTPGPKYQGNEKDEGSDTSHIRYETVRKLLDQYPEQSALDVRDTLSATNKVNFPNTTSTTEWSVVYDQQNLTATYYRQRDYKQAYVISLK